MSDYKYYAFDFATGTARDIFRNNVDTPKDFGTRGLWRAKKDGSWSDSDADLRPLLNCWMQCDFDLDDDEIAEERANAYLHLWHASDSWPGLE